MKTSSLQEKIQSLREADIKVKYKGFLAAVTNYIEKPTESQREKVKVYIYKILQPEEFIDFFLDNLDSMNKLNSDIEKAKNGNL